MPVPLKSLYTTALHHGCMMGRPKPGPQLTSPTRPEVQSTSFTRQGCLLVRLPALLPGVFVPHHVLPVDSCHGLRDGHAACGAFYGKP